MSKISFVSNKSSKKFKKLKDVIVENKKLFDELRKVNNNLTKLIDLKWYKNLLKKVKKDGKIEFKSKPVNIQIKTYEMEIKNNIKILELSNKELKKITYDNNKLSSTNRLSEVNKLIYQYKNKIKNIKIEFQKLELNNKLNAKALSKPDNVKSEEFKQLILEIDLYLNKKSEMSDYINHLEELLTKQNTKLGENESKNNELKEKMDSLGISLESKLNNKYKNYKFLIDKKKMKLKLLKKN